MLVPSAKRAKLTKNPFVDTSFLPDREREENERKMREELRKKWLTEQEEVKKEEIEVTYSYWDGSGHRKSVTVSKACHLQPYWDGQDTETLVKRILASPLMHILNHWARRLAMPV